jgi:hypothetical protein
MEQASVNRWDGWVVGLALAAASLGAMAQAGSWYDGSRLATVESLVDQHTWAIDHSIFVDVPPAARCQASPYPPKLRGGTFDKLWIKGHFYSDKSPLPALAMACEYSWFRALTGWTARERPAWFCWAMTLGSSGLAYTLAVWCVFRLGVPLGLLLRQRLLLAGSLALCTMAWAYSRQVNNHILLLAAAMALLVELAWLGRGEGQHTVGRFLRIGLLAGLAYAIDLGAGPVMCGLTGLVVLVRCRRPGLLACLIVAALPCVLLHHELNYAIGGAWQPANANPEYFQYPEAKFSGQTMTGRWNHPSAAAFVRYALDLLFGKKGVLLHNLPLLLPFFGAGLVVWKRPRELPECLLALAWCAGVWFVYAAASTNASGLCCSVRWFVPLLAPGFFVLALLLREFPEYQSDFLLLSGWGAALGALMAWGGPWSETPRLIYWFVVGCALASWGWLALARRLKRLSSADNAAYIRSLAANNPLRYTGAAQAEG